MKRIIEIILGLMLMVSSSLQFLYIAGIYPSELLFGFTSNTTPISDWLFNSPPIILAFSLAISLVFFFMGSYCGLTLCFGGWEEVKIYLSSLFEKY